MAHEDREAQDSEKPCSSSGNRKVQAMGCGKRSVVKDKKIVRIVNTRNSVDRNKLKTNKNNNGRAHAGNASMAQTSQQLTVYPLQIALSRARKLRARPFSPTTAKASSSSTNRELTVNETEKRELEKLGYVIFSNVGHGEGYSKHWACAFEKIVPSAFRQKTNLLVKVIEAANAELISDLKAREIKILCQLKHPNIVSLHSLLHNEKHLYLFTTRNACGTVLEYLSANGPLSEDHGRFWFRQILDGLEYLHSNNISHRDLNCETLLFGDHYNVLISDFTHAAFSKIDKVNVLSDFVNKSLYSAPEVLLGERYNAKMADLWSLGVVLYAFYLGHPPFQLRGTEDHQIARLVLDQLCKVWLVKKNAPNPVLHAKSWMIICALLEPDELKRATIGILKQSPFYSMKECICGYGSFGYFMNELSESPPAKLMCSSKIAFPNYALAPWRESQKNNYCPVLLEFVKHKKRGGLRIEDAEQFPTVINICSEESVDQW